MPAAADHLPDAMLDTTESILDAFYSFRTAEKRYRCLVAK